VPCTIARTGEDAHAERHGNAHRTFHPDETHFQPKALVELSQERDETTGGEVDVTDATALLA
jgi:hypothetical protein